MPDSDWMLKCLSTLNPHHKIFDKGYVYIAEKKKLQPYVDFKILDNQEFFKDLPELTKKKDLKGRGSAFLTPE